MAGLGDDELSARLSIRLLGAVEVRIEGTPVDIGGTQPRAIIAHLALDAGRIVPVDRLITRLWDEEPPRTPLGTLQSYVSRLRRLLEPQRAAGAPPSVLVSEAPGYVLVVPRTQVDVHRFTALADEARSALGADDPARALSAADRALALWLGDPLAGIGPEQQVGPIALPFVEQHAATIEDRFEALLALGRHREAVPALHAASEDAPLRERRWGLLATALYRSGRQADALRAIADVRSRLLDELGLDISPDLRTLERRILDQDPALAHHAHAHAGSASAPTVVTEAPPTTEPTAERAAAAPAGPDQATGNEPSTDRPPRVVGRQREWRELVAALDRAERGSTQLVLLEGEAGIGKSTLLEALAQYATQRGWRQATGRCVEAGLAPSLWPALEIVRDLVDGGTPPDAATNPLVQLIVDDVRPSAPTSVELVTSFVELLDALGSGPLLVILDDVHWADRATLDVLNVAAQRLGQRPVVIVAAFRPPGEIPGSQLTETLGRLRRLPALTSVVVSPLEVDEVAELMTQTSGATPDSELAAHVRARAGGNPLFVVELARLAGERGVAGPTNVPDAIRDVVRERLARLPERATAELEIAAVLGERFQLQTVIAASDRSADDCLDALDAAIVTRIIVPDGPDYRFAHALVRDAVLADLSPVRRQRLHAAVADAIAATLGDGPSTAEPIAHHRLAARAVLDPVLVAEALVAAADVARWKNALDDGEWFAEQALEVLEGARRGPGRLRAEVNAVEAIISVSYRRGESAADGLVDRIGQIATRSRSESVAALVLFLRFGEIDDVAHVTEVQSVVAEARELAARATEPYAVVTLAYLLASWSLLIGDPVSAVAECRRGFAATGSATPDDPPEHVPLVLLPLIAGMAEALTGDADSARVQVNRRMRAWLARRSEVDDIGEQNVTFSAALIEAVLGDPERLIARVAGYSAVGSAGLFPEQDASVELLITWAESSLGRPGELDRADRAMATLDAGPDLVLVAAMRSFHASAAMAAGDPRCVDMLADARSEAERRGEVWWLAEIVRLQALADARFGDGARVNDLLDEAAAIAGDQRASLLSARVDDTRARLAAATRA
ncbi:AfsR/SARP family transcriptional regulator [Desertimonas flava]|uniref:AfsR/SARP family transcriptional regulator n=1 Tax=Desertimonas flava TaxID=2064846 RepID=UPI0013C3F6CC|nr:AfsR/SARP family transcriptional regulator [Desertimonas flava]